MTRIWISGLFAAALGCAATLSGQTAGAAQAGKPGAATPPGGDAHRSVTVVGCVQHAGGTAGATGTSGVAGAAKSASSSGWILANASTDAAAKTAGSANREAGSPAGAAAGSATASAVPVPAGSGGGANRGMSGSTYILLAGEQDLTTHAGHKVEITGTLADMPGASAAVNTASEPGRSTSATTQTTANASAPVGQRLQVAAVKMISATCS